MRKKPGLGQSFSFLRAGGDTVILGWLGRGSLRQRAGGETLSPRRLAPCTHGAIRWQCCSDRDRVASRRFLYFLYSNVSRPGLPPLRNEFLVNGAILHRNRVHWFAQQGCERKLDLSAMGMVPTSGVTIGRSGGVFPNMRFRDVALPVVEIPGKPVTQTDVHP